MNLIKKIFLFTSIILVNQVYGGDQWTQKAQFGGPARHRCAAFAVGNKGYIGGGHINSGVSVWHKDWWQYDPGSDSWTQIADFGGGERYHSTAFGIGEFGYVGLGENNLDEYTKDFWKYIPQINIWVPLADFPGTERRGATCFVIDGYAYVGTGQSAGGYESDFYRYNPETNSWTQVADFLGEARSSAVGFAHNGKGYVGTGHIWGDDTKDFYEYDPVSDIWTQKADVGTINRQDATGFVLNDKGFIGTGNDVDGNENYKDFWIYDFDTDTWTQTNDFAGEGRRYMVSFVINNIAYCGTGTDGTNLRDMWAYQPFLNNQGFNTLFELSVYPNPSSDQIKITAHNIGSDSQELKIRIYSPDGRIILTKAFESNVSIRKSEIGSGNFIYVIQHDEEMVSTGKLSFI